MRVPQAKNKVSKVTAKRKQHETRVKILALRRMLAAAVAAAAAVRPRDVVVPVEEEEEEEKIS